MTTNDPFGLEIEIEGLAVVDLLKPTMLLRLVSSDPIPTITVSADQFRRITIADYQARTRLGDGRFDKPYFKEEVGKIIDPADMELLERGTARLVLSEL